MIMEVFMVVMHRNVPEKAGHPTRITVQEQDIPALQKRGWFVAEPVKNTVTEPAKVEVKEEVKEEPVVADEPEVAVEQKAEKKTSKNRREV
jgi:hypothetical protein